MTNDERISAYIDNELTGEQEQELLISLAANDSLRKSFRSELVLKKVLRADERGVNPPRQLRTAVFAAIGLGAAAMATADAQAASTSVSASRTASAPSAPAASAPTHGLLKTLFASKINALLTAVGLTVAGVAGYGVHTLTATSPVQHEVVVPVNLSPSAPQLSPAITETEKPAQTVTRSQASPKHPVHRAIQQAASTNPSSAAAADTTPAHGVNGVGEVEFKDPIMTKASKK
jgi:negative regulator of sigma E activity